MLQLSLAIFNWEGMTPVIKEVLIILSLQVCGFKIIRVTVYFAVTVNRNRHSKKKKRKKSLEVCT